MRLLLLFFTAFVLAGCNFPDHQTIGNSSVQAKAVDELVKDSQALNKLGNYQELFVAPFMGGHAVVQAATPKGLESNSLAFYWVQNQQQAYAINDRAIDLSPELPQYHQLPVEIDPKELLETVKKSY